MLVGGEEALSAAQGLGASSGLLRQNRELVSLGTCVRVPRLSAQCWQQQFSVVFACLLLSESKMYYSLLLYTLHGVETKIRYELKVHQSLLTGKIDRDSKSSFFFLLFTHSSTTCRITQEELSCSDASQGIKTTVDTVILSLAGVPVCCLPLTRYYWVVSQMVWMRPKGL